MLSSKDLKPPHSKITQQSIQILLSLLAFYLHHQYPSPVFLILSMVFLLLCVLASVHQAEIIAARIGEPFGALVLAIAITAIEVSMIISFMLSAEGDSSNLARDTVFAAVMIILTGMLGLSLLVGGIRFRSQYFLPKGVTSILTVLFVITILTLILPNFSKSAPGPFYSTKELIFISVITIFLYSSFLFVQNFRHRDDFIDENSLQVAELPNRKTFTFALVLMPLNLILVILLAESMAPDLESLISYLNAPTALSGIIIACVILLPEGISAFKAANNNQLQKSLNLSMGSALASISLTIPIVSITSIVLGVPIALGIGAEMMVILLMCLLVVIISLSQGRTTILNGIVLLLLFAVYLFEVLFA